MLVLFARYPERGVGKRRIAKDLGDPETYLLSKHLYINGWFDLLRWPGPTAVATTSEEPLDESTPFKVNRLDRFLLQEDGNLGERIKKVEQELREEHFGPLIFIGSDAPELTNSHLAATRKLLKEYDVVLGPAADGGVTLMAVKESWPPLHDLPWGTDQLCDSLKRRCEAYDLDVGFISDSYDTDDCYDLLRLRNSLAEDARPDRKSLHHFLSQLFPTVGVVIPARNDHLELARLIEHLQQLTIDNIVVVDSTFDPLTAQRCRKHGVQYTHGGTSRGERMDIGAKLIEDDIIWFLHADARPDKSAADEIRLHIKRGHSGGWFRFRFDSTPHPLKKALEVCINWRAKHGIPYGDQGLFVRRKTYKKTCGISHQPLFEEVQLVKELRKRNRLGMPFKALDMTLGVSDRRWQADGWIKRTLHNRWLALQYIFGADPDDLAAKYRGNKK